LFCRHHYLFVPPNLPCLPSIPSISHTLHWHHIYRLNLLPPHKSLLRVVNVERQTSEITSIGFR
jgi:hypothetical protein